MKKILLLSALFMCAIGLFAQDLHFSQHYEAPLMMNPSQAGGFKGDQRAVLNYKDQWRSVAQAYRTYNFSFDMSFKKQSNSNNYLGAGINIFADKSGDVNLSTTQADLFVAYHLAINDNQYISGGIKGGVSQRSIDPSQMEWGNQYDAASNGYNSSISSNEDVSFNQFYNSDFAGGITWNYGTKNATLSSNDALEARVGYAATHINSPKLSYDNLTDEKLYTRHMFHVKLRKGLKNTNLQLEPGGYIQFKKTSKEIIFGTNVRYILREESKYTDLVKGAAVSLGCHYRYKDAVIVLALMEFGKFAVGGSYDINTSKLRAASNGKGGFELTLRYVTPNPFKEKKSAARFM